MQCLLILKAAGSIHFKFEWYTIFRHHFRKGKYNTRVYWIYIYSIKIHKTQCHVHKKTLRVINTCLWHAWTGVGAEIAELNNGTRFSSNQTNSVMWLATRAVQKPCFQLEKSHWVIKLHWTMIWVKSIFCFLIYILFVPCWVARAFKWKKHHFRGLSNLKASKHSVALRLLESQDDVIKWKHFPRYRPFVRGIHRSPVNSTHKGQWRGTLMFPLICALNKRFSKHSEAGDLRRQCAHYDVTVMGIKMQ